METWSRSLAQWFLQTCDVAAEAMIGVRVVERLQASSGLEAHPLKLDPPAKRRERPDTYSCKFQAIKLFTAERSKAHLNHFGTPYFGLPTASRLAKAKPG